ncbi:cytochrome P450 [Mycobacterium sp. OTB74]|jgi:cytochrome P450|uniref:cytochrome P450 n=1 Tax=Mycobacterium sp. OTB74 TaxID=1853452 RepID=UPI002476C1C0|nr:cytochrome P450 [Mycobacterium sp. OTB74]
MLYLRYREWFLPLLRKRFGDVFSLHVPPYADDLVVFAAPEAIGEIFRADPHVLHAGEGNQILGAVLGEHSVLLVDEDAHRRVRGLLMPAFNGAALRQYRAMITDQARAEVVSWAPNTEIAMLAAMNRLTLDIIITVVFGVTDPATKSELVDRLRAIINISPAIFAGFRFPVLQRIPPWKGFADNQARIDAILYREIASRRAAADLASRGDVLSRLIRSDGDAIGDPLTDAELRDQLVSLLLAGHETTAAALAWTLWELARHPESQSAARAAASRGDDKYLDAAFKEGLRRHSVIVSTARKLTQPMTIGGHRLPLGTVVNTSILLAHNDPRNHRQPDEFRPERFLGTSPPPNTWLPFGGGVRRCLGAGFATTEATVILAEILTRWELHATGAAESARVRNITTVPRHGAVLRVTPIEPRTEAGGAAQANTL